MTTITNADKLREARRELQMRIDVYPRWVELRLVTRADADRRIAIMKKIVDDYEAIAERTVLPS